MENCPLIDDLPKKVISIAMLVYQRLPGYPLVQTVSRYPNDLTEALRLASGDGEVAFGLPACDSLDMAPGNQDFTSKKQRLDQKQEEFHQVKPRFPLLELGL